MKGEGGGRGMEGEEVSLERRRKERGRRRERRVRLSMWKECLNRRMGAKEKSPSLFSPIFALF